MAQGKADAWGETVIAGKLVGRDNIVIPPEQVEDLAQLGCTNREIANFFGVTETALSRNFAAELTKAREILKHNLRRAMLHNACVNYNAAVQIFLSKNLLGMSDTGLTSEEFKPLPWTDSIDDDQFEDEDVADAADDSTLDAAE